MNQIIREASTRLENLLPEDQHFFSADDLKALGMPDFIVDRIQCDVVRMLHKTLGTPGSDWLDEQHSDVVAGWQKFLSAVKPLARMPRHHAAEIIDNAVIDVVEMLCRPRHRTLEVLFGMDATVSIETIQRRSEWITVNQHLSEALIRYMQRKELREMSRSEAERILKIVDDRYVEGFSPLAWAQSLDLLFQLSDNKVEKDLIIDYFIDKERDDLAALFQSWSGNIDRALFIERIALGQMEEFLIPDEHPIETEQPEPELQFEPEPESEPEVEPEPQIESEPDLESEPQIEADLEHEPELQPEPLPESEAPLPLYEVLEKAATPAVPIWQQFLQEADEETNEMEETIDKTDITIPVSKPQQDPVPDKMAQTLGQHKIALVDWLKPDENDYIESIFLGNQHMYFRSVGSIEHSDDWSEAQVFIKESIIDLLELEYEDPVLIQFIDQVHSYFTSTVS
jgi:hypothetical protein